jgi:hypothetical protein
MMNQPSDPNTPRALLTALKKDANIVTRMLELGDTRLMACLETIGKVSQANNFPLTTLCN